MQPSAPDADLRIAPVVVVGAGLFGLTIAERTANSLGLDVVIIEERSHVGGNAYSYIDSRTGIEVHRYGSHLFHTSNEKVWEYVNTFTAFNSYVHRVFTRHGANVFSLPINLHTVSQYLGNALTPREARDWIDSQRDRDSNLKETDLESKAISLIGKPLYEAFIRGYTEKQWQTPPSELPADVITRLPVRFDFDSRYFSDTWEGLPLGGYGRWFDAMLANPSIRVLLETDFFQVRDAIREDALIIYTGPIDRFFDYQFGHLGWRTLDFEFEIVETDDFQGTSVMNYADSDVPFTRIHEFKHLHPEREYSSNVTNIAREFSRRAEVSDEPYYPVSTPNDREMLAKYRSLAHLEPNVLFGGRLGTYKYLDMHMAIASALTLFVNEVEPRLAERRRA